MEELRNRRVATLGFLPVGFELDDALLGVLLCAWSAVSQYPLVSTLVVSTLLLVAALPSVDNQKCPLGQNHP